MTYDEFTALCEKEWANGFGDVRELHLDAIAGTELAASLDNPVLGPPDWMSLGSLYNPATGSDCKVVHSRNHAVVHRPPVQPAGTRHTVNLP